jgi:micrococcal nuclease
MTRLVDGKTLICDLTGERMHGREVVAEVIGAGFARDCRRFSDGRYARLERPEAKRLPLPTYCEPR